MPFVRASELINTAFSQPFTIWMPIRLRSQRNKVNDLLKLHRGKKAPSNVNASLRSYMAYVEIAGTEKPYRWSLTGRGLDQLRKLSNLTLTTAKVNEASFLTDIAFVCALRHPEFAALVTAAWW